MLAVVLNKELLILSRYVLVAICYGILQLMD
ncbi:MAG TPA: ATP synthase B chain precursor-like protein [Caudoviricetes sp.]|nr:MAG TPA: ATP synthase B chain precursor-like protein [Caudoviricetes sp.]